MGLPCVATCSRGLEGVLAGELEAYGIVGTRVAGAVEFCASVPQLVHLNFWLRTASRVLVRVGGGPCLSRGDLYQLASSVPWEDYLRRDATVAVQVNGRHEAFVNTHFAALVVKDALVDRLREKRGQRPSVNLQDPDLRVVVHLQPNSCSLFLDSSGEPLSHRGYRQKQAAAPLSENLAAALLLLAGYDGTKPFLDPMCGSGTIVIEAALLASGTPPGWRRSFAFERWPFVEGAWLDQLRQAARAHLVTPSEPIAGSDVSSRAVALAQRAAKAAGVQQAVRFSQQDVRRMPPLAPGTLVISNPPYGLRVGEEAQLSHFYRQLGDTLKHAAVGSEVWLLLGNPRLARQLGLRPQRKFSLFNGPLPCQFCCYPVVEGSFRRSRGARPSDRLAP
ncbi:MAG: THUMP domain-containing protein [Thermoanaerobaculum sp.]|nr:THUMP domain-containing protein [Thermoanaerobaculum sp.]